MTGISVAASQVVLAIVMTGQSGSVLVTNADTTVRLRVVLHTPVTPADLTLARNTADALLGAGGVLREWSVCSALEGVCENATGPNAITVRLVPTRTARPQACGHLTRDPRLGTTALVHVRGHEELAHVVRTSSAGRSHPALSTLTTGHVMGLTIAHEVGHALGLRHAGSGVMKGRVAIDDLLALRAARLAFEPGQSAQMQQVLTGATNQFVGREIESRP